MTKIVVNRMKQIQADKIDALAPNDICPEQTSMSKAFWIMTVRHLDIAERTRYKGHLECPLFALVDVIGDLT